MSSPQSLTSSLCRTYRCGRCSFCTTKPRHYLEHERDVHGDDITIFPCELCDYASKYKNKVDRHLRNVHKIVIPHGMSVTPGKAEIVSNNGVATPSPRLQALLAGRDIQNTNLDNSNSMDEMMVNENGEQLAIVDEECLSFGELSVLQQRQDNLNGTPPTQQIYVNQLAEDNGDYVMADDDATEDIINSTGEVASPNSSRDDDDDYNDDLGEEDTDLDHDGQSAPATLERTNPCVQEDAYAYIDQLKGSGMRKSSADDPALFSCQLCPYQHGQKWKVANHVRSSHLNQSLFRCSKCPFVCAKKIEYCVHKTTHQSHKRLYRCAECTYQTAMKRNFDRHLTRHRVAGPVKCDDCSYSSTGEAAIQRHMTEYHPIGSSITAASSSSPISAGHKVDVATKPSTSRRLMKILKSSPVQSPVHNGGGINGYCNSNVANSNTTSFNSKDPNKAANNTLSSLLREPLIQRRPLSRADIDALTCSVCYVVLASEVRLTSHMIAHADIAPYACPRCPMRYVEKPSLMEHLSKIHKLITREDGTPSTSAKPLSETNSNQSMPIITADENGIFNCEQCTYQVKSASEMRRHLLDHSAQKKFKCRYCNDRYKTHLELNQHLRKMHNINLATTRAEENSEANEHQMKMSLDNGHPSDTNKMSIMAVTAASNNNNNNNNNNRTAMMIKCPQCPYVGQYRAEVARHMLLHTGKKQWSCNYCVYKTYWKGDMKRHLQRHHSSILAESGEDIFEMLENTKINHDIEKPEPIIECVNSKDGDDMKNEIKCESSITAESLLHSNKEIRCPLCSFVCSGGDELSVHMSAHGDLKRYACDRCGHRCNYVWMTRKHIRSAHAGQPEVKVVALSETVAADTLTAYLATESAAATASSATTATASSATTATASSATAGVDDFDVATESLDADASLTVEAMAPGTAVITSADMSDLDVKTGHYDDDDDDEDDDVVGSEVKVSQYDDDDAEDDYEEQSGDGDDDNNGDDNGSSGAASATYEQSDAEHTPSLLPDGASPGNFTSRCRPFKCSLCGRRSNWKWDVTKHIKSVHNNDPKARILVLSESDAMATLHTVVPFGKATNTATYSPTQNKMEMPTSKPRNNKDRNRPFKCSKCGLRSNWKWDVTKHIRMFHADMEPLPDLIILDPVTAANTPYTPPVYNSKRSDVTAKEVPKDVKTGIPVPWLNRRFRCEICMNKANYRSDIVRHVKRVHKVLDPQIINLSVTDLMTTLTEDEIIQMKGEETPPKPFYKSVSSSQLTAALTPLLTAGTPATPPSGNSGVYQCSRCDFEDKCKSSVVQHYATHAPGAAFQCCLCGDKSDYRNSIYRHIRNRHRRSDYNSIIIEAAIRQPGAPAIVDDVAGVIGGVTAGVNVQLTSRSRDAVDERKPAPLKMTTTRRHRCPDCEYSGNDDADLQRHRVRGHAVTATPEPATATSGDKLKRKSPAKPLRLCDVCPYRTRNENAFMIHCDHHYPSDGKDLKCKFCDFYVDNRNDLDLHSQLHCTGVYLCKLCPYKTDRKFSLMAHSQHHRKRASAVYKCTYCPYWLSDKEKLSQHLGLHRKTSTIDCQEPPAKKQKLDANDHLNGTNESDDFTLKESVSMVYKPKPYTRKIHRCRSCPYQNYKATRMRNHERMHGMRDHGLVTTSGRPLLKCLHCDYYAGNKGLIIHHQKVHSPSYKPEIEEEQQNDSVNDDISSPAALVQFASDITVTDSVVATPTIIPDVVVTKKKYIYYVHKSFTQNVSKCDRCPYATNVKHLYRQHKHNHGREKKFKCSLCDYSDDISDEIQNHILLHKDNKNLLIKAELVEEPDQKYICTKCPFQSDQRLQLSTHLVHHNLADGQRCSFCSYRSAEQDLRVHLLLHVNSITKALNNGGEIIIENNSALIRNRYGVKVNMFGD